ncbi:COG3014 family protein [Vibrio sp. E150_011]|uniref:COG3014 family protein n=1 Tax=Vibrio sp. 10N.261.51.F12 TaxID=3229679 RepID=UPI00354DFE56
MLKRRVKHTLVAFLSLSVTACAGLTAGNLFSHYSQQNATVYQAVKNGQYQQAQSALPPEPVAGDILDNLEKGRVEFLGQAYPESKLALEVSDKAVRVQQDKALLSISDAATSVGALAVNDNITEYVPPDYELGFLHLYLGLNYIQKNDLEGALVEVRRANQVQERARQSREKDLKSAESELKQKGISPNLGSVLSRYPDAGSKLQAVQNGYLLFLSGLLYEASNDLNGAYIDYTRALAVAPDNKAVIDAVMRVAKRAGRRQALDELKKQYGEPASLEVGQGRVIVLEERGAVSAMQSWNLSLPVYDSQGNTAIYSIALPHYVPSPQPAYPAVTLDGKSLKGDGLVDVNLMAQQQLTENMPSILVRQALRVYAKDQIRKSTAKDDDVGNLLFNVWNTLTEQPDTRSWQTLPSTVNSSSNIVKAGTHTIIVDGQDYTFDVRDKQTTLVWLSRQGGSATIWHKQLGRL